MMNKYDRFTRELADHMQTLEKYAETFPSMTCSEKNQAVGAAIFSIGRLLLDGQYSKIMETIGRDKSYRSRFLAILRRIYATLCLVYVPKSDGVLHDWAIRGINAVNECYERYS